MQKKNAKKRGLFQEAKVSGAGARTGEAPDAIESQGTVNLRPSLLESAHPALNNSKFILEYNYPNTSIDLALATVVHHGLHSH